MTDPLHLNDLDAQRLAYLAADSRDRDVVLIEVVYHGQWARFDISATELAHLSAADVWRRHIGPALAAVKVPGAAESLVGTK